MVYEISAVNRYIGLSSDTKPTPDFYGSTFFETDTRLTHICYDGVNWTQYVDSGGSGSGAMQTSTNPAANAAVTTTIIDAYSGVIILQNDGTPANQTLANPTITTAGKIFTVVNNDTSVDNETVIANGVSFTVTPGEAQSFIWDGTAWGPIDLGITAIPVVVAQGGTGLTTITDHGIMLGSGMGAVTPMTVLDTGAMLVGVTGADPTAVVANITTTKKFLTETGTGAVGATPTFETIISADIATALSTPPVIGGTTPAAVYATPAVNKGPAIITSFAGTVSTSGSSTTITWSSAADAILAGYHATNPTLGTTIITGPINQASVTRYVVSWTNATACVVDSACTLAAATELTSIQLPITTFVNSSGVTKGWINAAGNCYFVGNFGIGMTTGYPLDVNGTIKGSTLYIPDALGADVGNGGNIWVGSDYTTNLAGYQLGFNTGANNARTVKMVIQNGGNVGIGTIIFGTVEGGLSVNSERITAGSGTGVTLAKYGSVNRQIYQVTVTYAALAAAALTADKVIATLPAKTKLVGIYADTTIAYTGGTVTAATLQVGKTTGGIEYIVAHDVLTAAVTKGLADADLGTSINRASAVQGGDLPSWTATTNVSVRLTTVAGNTNALTAGSTTYYLETERF